MAQDLTVNIKTTSDVPQAMEKAKAATSGFDKQVEGIGKKFAGAFKDIFLSFLGPMALLALAVKFVSDIIDANKKKAADAIAFAEEGQSSLLSNGDKEVAQMNKRNEEEKKAKENAKNAPEANAEKFIKDNKQLFGGGVDKVLGDMYRSGSKLNATLMWLGINDMASSPEFQQALAKRAAKENFAAGGVGTGKEFTNPTGFSNVIGVGANPVIEAMTAQLEEARVQTALLEAVLKEIANPNGTSADFTKEPQRYPGRGYIPQ
jgi:hypothetical protein